MNDSSHWDRVQDLFHDALALDPAAREAMLVRLDADDPGAAAEVRSLLAAHAGASGFLADPPAARLFRGLAPGERLGPYRIVEEIGRGGMGVVVHAVRDDGDFTKDVAIKLIDPGMRSESILRRFRAERQILAMLDHPHIARLIDGGTAPDGSPYLVMDYVQGRPLLAHCDAHRLDIESRLRLFLQVCDAVQFAHQRLVVHRDLKSDNVLVAEDGTPRLLDFGIAKLLSSDDGGDAPTLTAPMQRMLTPDYASPEQIRGEPVTVASDVYSLGVVLYELLTGARPLKLATRSPEEIVRVATQQDPLPPSRCVGKASDDEAATRRGDTTRRLRRRLSGDLDHVVLKALDKDPARRYGSVEQLARDLRLHLDGRPVGARGASTAYRMSRFVRRHRVAVVATGLVVASVLAGLAGTVWQARVAGRERDRAQRRFEEVRSLAHAVVFDLHDAIAPLPGSTRARELLVQHALRYLDGLARESKGDPALERELAIAYSKIGDVQGRPMFANLGQTAQALASYEKSLGLLENVMEAWPESSTVVHDWVMVGQWRADVLGVMGRHREAMEQSLASREAILEQLALRPGDRMFEGDLSVATNRLTDMKLVAGDTTGSIEECATNVRLAEKFFAAAPTDPNTRRAALIAYAKMANLRALQGARDSALATYARAERLALEAVAALPHNVDARRDLSIVYGMQALFLSDVGSLDSALTIYDRGMVIAEQLAAADPSNALQQADVAAGHFEIGTLMMKGRRHHEAERRFGEAFTRYRTLVAADTGNAEHRAYMARSARQAGEACRALAASAAGDARTRWRAKARRWLATSRDVYGRLAAAGALNGPEAEAPREVAEMMAGLDE